MTAKILEVSPDGYHQLPGLSASIATTLIMRSPLHAWQQHPLYGAKGKKPTKEMDRGQVVHALSLGKGKGFRVLDVDDFRTKAARELRDTAREEGLVPIKREDFEEASACAAAVVKKLKEHDIDLNGASELAIAWTEETEFGPVECRGMFDHVWIDRGRILDLKIVGTAAPLSVERSAENFGYAIQAHAYSRALAKLKPELAGRIDFLFAFCEADEPHDVNLCMGDGMFRELGERRWQRAVTTWAECIANNKWPGYGSGINTLSPPAWALNREELAA